MPGEPFPPSYTPTDTRSELNGSPVESREGFGFKATRRWICNWYDRHYVRDLLLGWPGEIYPYAPEFFAYARNVGIQGFGKIIPDPYDGSFGAYEKAIISCEYESGRAGLPSKDPSNATEIISEELQPVIEMWNVHDRNYLRWKTAYQKNTNTEASPVWVSTKEVTPDQMPGVQVMGLNLIYTRHNLATINVNVLNLMGSINKFPVTSRTFGLTFPAECMLYQPPQISAATQSDGAQRYAVTMVFCAKNIPSWNKFFRPDLYDGVNWASAFDTIQRWNGSAWADMPTYPVKDWAPLFP